MQRCGKMLIIQPRQWVFDVPFFQLFCLLGMLNICLSVECKNAEAKLMVVFWKSTLQSYVPRRFAFQEPFYENSLFCNITQIAIYFPFPDMIQILTSDWQEMQLRAPGADNRDKIKAIVQTLAWENQDLGSNTYTSLDRYTVLAKPLIYLHQLSLTFISYRRIWIAYLPFLTNESRL